MKAAAEMRLCYDQELLVTQQLCEVTRLIRAFVEERKTNRLPKLMSHRQELLDSLKHLEQRSAYLGRGVFAQWHSLSPDDRAAIQTLRARIAENLGTVALADQFIRQFLEQETTALGKDLQKISAQHILHAKYSAEEDSDPRYFRMSA